MSYDAFKYLNITVDANGIAKMVLNRPDVRNALNVDFMHEITEAFHAMDQDPAVKAVVLSGEGKVFSAGADMHWMGALVGSSFEDNVSDCKNFTDMMSAAYRFSKPLIGKVHGAAMGGGVGLAAACDYAIAQEGTKFAFSEVKLCIYPAMISPYCIPKIGTENANYLFKSGKDFFANDAKKAGLVDAVASQEAIDASVDEIATYAAANGKVKLREISRHLRNDREVLEPTEYGIESGMEEKMNQLIAGVAERANNGAQPNEMNDFTIPFTAAARVTPEAQAKLREAVSRAGNVGKSHT